jgi:SPP1 gp7 family putative phage head morphogenesis protein
VQSAVAKLKAATAGFFEQLRRQAVKQIAAALRNTDKVSEEDEKRVQRILDDIDFEGYEAFVDIVRAELNVIHEDAAGEAASQLADALGMPISVDALAQANAEGITYAQDRAAEMVGMKWVDGELIPNPNAEWQITEATREMLRGDVTEALEQGLSNDELADKLADNYAFSDERAEMVARTETARADVEGSLATYRASGVVEGKQWITGADCCDECQDMDGEVVPLDGQFEGGASDPPLHPSCRCDVLPVVSDETTEEDQ